MIDAEKESLVIVPKYARERRENGVLPPNGLLFLLDKELPL